MLNKVFDFSDTEDSYMHSGDFWYLLLYRECITKWQSDDNIEKYTWMD